MRVSYTSSCQVTVILIKKNEKMADLCLVADTIYSVDTSESKDHIHSG